jgi:hypothetical protein
MVENLPQHAKRGSEGLAQREEPGNAAHRKPWKNDSAGLRDTMTSGGGGAHTDAHRTRAPSLPKLDIGKVSEQNRAGAPVTVDRLLSTLRSRWKPAHETELFQDFEDRVNEIMSGGSTGCKMDPAFRIFTFYDEAIIPAGSAQATIRTTRQVCGESPLEIIFGFFCSRQQPGTG